MKVLFLPQVYPPEAHPTAVMMEQLARALVAQGHAVTVACGYPHHPTGEVLGGYVKRPFLRESSGGVEILRGWHATTTNRAIPARAAVMLSQSLGATVAAMQAGPPDVVLNLGPPLVGPLAGALVARRFGAKHVTVIFDIYPDVAVTTGKVRSTTLIAAANLAARIGFAASDRVVVLSEGFRRAMITKGVPPEKLAVIPVWLDANEVRPLPRATLLRAELELDPARFVVLYAGTIGLVSGAVVVAEAAARVTNPDVVFLFVGGGEALGEVKARVSALGLQNVRFAPFQPRSRLADVQASADVGLVTLGPGLGRTSVPSKVLGYLAAGTPVLASVDGESDTARCVEQSGGVVVPPGDGVALARAVDDLSRRNLTWARAASRAAFLRDYTADVAVRKYVDLFEQVVAR